MKERPILEDRGVTQYTYVNPDLRDPTQIESRRAHSACTRMVRCALALSVLRKARSACTHFNRLQALAAGS